MPHRYELHAHTKEGSACASVPAKDIMRMYRDNGYAGVCITEHFTGGKNALPNDTPWERRVAFFDAAFQKAREEGEGIGLSVFFGFELTPFNDVDNICVLNNAHILVFNIEPRWLVENRHIFAEDHRRQLNTLRKAGAFLIHAHPCREPQTYTLYPGITHAIEVINGGRTELANHAAKRYAQTYGLPEVAGSDFHHPTHECFTGIETENRCGTINDLITCIKNRDFCIYVSNPKQNIEQSIVRRLALSNQTVTFAESCTGGMLAARLVDIPGASRVFGRSFVTYSNQSKIDLGVSPQTLEAYGAVSEETAREMAANAARVAKSDAAVAVTGIAGPDGGTDEKPVGLVYICVYLNGHTQTERHVLTGSRTQIRQAASDAAMDVLFKTLNIIT
jgi:PncC family amidohydrolase